MYKLLYNKPKKKLRKELKPCKIDRAAYEDTERIRELIGPVGDDETLRVRLIRNEPTPAYRVTILKRYKLPHTTKYHDDRTVTLQPGLYVEKQWWCESQKDGFTFTPALPARSEDNA